jgi:hypothetical protein
LWGFCGDLALLPSACRAAAALEILFISSAYRGARGYFAQALSITRDINTPVEEARALEGIGRCHIQEGSPSQGAAHIRQALAIYRRIGAPEAQRVEATLLN